MKTVLAMHLLWLLPLMPMAAAFAQSDGKKAGKPDVGDTAPLFELQGSDGVTYKLEDFIGKKTVILAWFPKAFTGG